MRYVLTFCLGLLALTACQMYEPLPAPSPGHPAPSNPSNPAPAQPQPAQPQTPAPPPAQTRKFRLSAASSSLVTQAHTQTAKGDTAAAATTLERALRIEPGNPLLWMELGRLRLSEKNPAQAESMGRKALALATGDPGAQASAWHLIAESLRARGRNAEAVEAEQRAHVLLAPFADESIGAPGGSSDESDPESQSFDV